MSIELDWKVSDAPTDDEVAPRNPSIDQRQNQVNHQPARPPSAKPLWHLLASGLRRRWWLGATALLAVLAAAGLWLFTQVGWQKVTGDVAAAVNYEDRQAASGAANLLLNVQDHGNADWLGIRKDEALARQPAPLPMPFLSIARTPASVTSLTALDADFVVANVNRQFTTPDGQLLTFSLPQFYRRGTSNDWLRSAPPGSFWGNWQDWQGTQLIIRYSERDAAFVQQVGPILDERLHAACAAWVGGCHVETPVRLYLSGFVGSLEYNPVANTEVRIELGPAGGSAVTPADYFLSVPSPQIAGIPTDDAGRGYLTDYLTVRVIASLARHASTMPQGYYQRMSQSIQVLGLARADPGYLIGGRRGHIGAFGASDLPLQQGSNVPWRGQDRQTWRVVYYTTVPGDTLPDIAARFKTSVSAIQRANRLANPDFLATGAKLIIPLPGPGATTAP